MATLQETNAFGYQNFVRTALTSDITSSATDIFLDSVPTPSEGTLIINPDSAATREIIFYNSKTGTKVTCPSAALGRGYDNTTATSHTAGTAVIMAPIADWFASIQTGQVLDSGSISTLKLDAALQAGWRAASGTWTYASATTFTVPAADIANMAAGTKIWLTQTTSKYFYVVGLSGTTVTVTGGTDYTVANAAITAPYYSNSVSAVGFPASFNYTVTWTGVTATFTSVNRFWLDGRHCTVVVARSTNQTSNATTFTASLPITAATVAGLSWRGTGSRGVDNGVAFNTPTPFIEVTSAGTVANLYTGPFPGSWANVNGKGVDFQVTYEI